jgi:hypothetical protein
MVAKFDEYLSSIVFFNETMVKRGDSLSDLISRRMVLATCSGMMII